MKYDLILAGVGGQGGLSGSVIIASAAMGSGLEAKQSEIHGMSQRGGEVQAALRLSDKPIASPLIPFGTASLILSFEPLEGLRYLPYLAPNGRLITATAPVKNIGNYPEIEGLLEQIRSIPNSILVDADKIAKKVGAARAANMVMVGAAARFLPLKTEALEQAIRKQFAAKGETIVETNIQAFREGCAITG
jgi:indolepyruvate ferredoxin oxidoreductase beta subunit